MLIFLYKSKKELKENIGKTLKYRETSLFGNEYEPNGELLGSNRPHITGLGREFFAVVKLENNIIKSVR
jgi:hypothetical protein